MAKKKSVSNDTSALPTTPAATRAPARRRAPAKKKSGNGKTEAQPTEAEIAEAAYFRHLKRGGHGDDQFNDWIEAERELKAQRR